MIVKVSVLVKEIKEEKLVLESYGVVPLLQTKSHCSLFLSQAQQKEVTEIDILVKNQGILRHSSYTLPLEESMLFSLSRDSDVLFTLPNLSRKGTLKDCYRGAWVA